VTLQLRPIDEAAAEAIVAAGCPEGFACAPDYPAEGDHVAAGMFLERCAADADPRPFGAFLVCLAPDACCTTDSEAPELIIGGIGFHGPPDANGRAEVGYGIVPSQRRNGYATQALRLLVEHARDLGAGALIAETEHQNEASRAVLTRVGFARFAEDDREAWFELALGCP
jgi:RimJ/RimL family protein N-acetyltransferase